jgi:hypothetical protein
MYVGSQEALGGQNHRAGALMATKQKMPMAFIYAAIAVGAKRSDAHRL